MNQISFFSCGNGDSAFIEAHGVLILTDVNYRQSAQDGGNDDYLDFGPDIRRACADAANQLHIFALTHPDKDHLAGFPDLFHVGAPERWNPAPSYGHPKILVNEIWCSAYALNPNYTTDQSKPLLDEIARRNALRGTSAGSKNGNRLQVMAAGKTGTVVSGQLDYVVFAPTESEAKIPKQAPGEENAPSSNSSSLVIEWTITVDDRLNRIVLGGDSTVDIWERIARDSRNGGRLPRWHVILAPHHCSRYSMGRKKPQTNEFEWSDDAIAALSDKVGRGFVVSSSKAMKRDDDDPPSWSAKQRYIKILAGAREPVDDGQQRFICTGDAGENGTCGHVVFSLTSAGPIRKAGGTKAAHRDSAIAGGGGYG